MPIFRVMTLDALPAGSMAAFEIEGTPILVARVDDEVYAMSNVCSHAHALLSEGDFDDEEYCVECPLHGARFDIRSGTPRTLPAFEPVATYRAYVEDNAVFVDFTA